MQHDRCGLSEEFRTAWQWAEVGFDPLGASAVRQQKLFGVERERAFLVEELRMSSHERVKRLGLSRAAAEETMRRVQACVTVWWSRRARLDRLNEFLVAEMEAPDCGINGRETAAPCCGPA